ncbi:MAG: PHB depolymerase family esterase [Aquirhabdus sp.]
MMVNISYSKVFKAIAAALFCTSIHQIASAATINAETIARPEGQRQYLFAQPDRMPAGKRPLVILLHGHLGSAAQLLGQKHSAAPMSVWLKIADRDGVLLITPDGAKGRDDKQGWNDCRADESKNTKTDDVGLIQAIIKRAVSEHQADPARIYVMGMSNGAMMTFRIASELGDQLAGFATVSGSMASMSNCPAPKVPVSALIISGTADPLVPYAGGNVHFMSNQSLGGVISVDQSTAVWRKLNGLAETPHSVTTLPHLNPDDKTSATRTIWGSNPKGLQVELLRIDNGGHMEPSLTQHPRRFYTMIVGAQNEDVETAEEAWSFFKEKRVGLK